MGSKADSHSEIASTKGELVYQDLHFTVYIAISLTL